MKVAQPIKFSTLILLQTVYLISCSSIEIFKEKTEFTPYKEYQSFVISNKEIGQRGFSDTFIDGLVSDQIQSSLENLGLVYEKENPEIIIRYTSNEDFRQKDTYNNLYPMWGGRVWDPWMYDPAMFQNPISTKNYELLQVMVDFIDPKNNKFLMQLTAVSEVNSKKDKEKKVLKSIEKIMQTYQQHLSSN